MKYIPLSIATLLMIVPILLLAANPLESIPLTICAAGAMGFGAGFFAGWLGIWLATDRMREIVDTLEPPA